VLQPVFSSTLNQKGYKLNTESVDTILNTITEEERASLKAEFAPKQKILKYEETQFDRDHARLVKEQEERKKLSADELHKRAYKVTKTKKEEKAALEKEIIPPEESSPAFKMSEYALGKVKKHEGEILSVYRDHLGYLTVGTGHLITKAAKGSEEERTALNKFVTKYGLTINEDKLLTDKNITTSMSKENSDILLQKDLQTAISDMEKYIRVNDIKNLNNVQKSALVEFMFNLGYTRVNKFRKLKQSFKSGNWNKVKSDALDSVWKTQVGPTRSKSVAGRMAYRSKKK